MNLKYAQQSFIEKLWSIDENRDIVKVIYCALKVFFISQVNYLDEKLEVEIML